MANPIDVVASKAKAIGHSMAARRDGLVGVFLTLAKQHAEAKALMERLQADDSKRASLWPKIKVALLSHEKAELEAVFPVLGNHAALKASVAQHQNEADELSRTIDMLSGMVLVSEEWGSLFDELVDSVSVHALEEETDIFPMSLKEVGPEVAKQLDGAFKTAHKRIEASLEKH